MNFNTIVKNILTLNSEKEQLVDLLIQINLNENDPHYCTRLSEAIINYKVPHCITLQVNAASKIG
jgi:hypothetical protein